MSNKPLTEGNVFNRVALNLYYYRTNVMKMTAVDLSQKAGLGINSVSGIENQRHAPSVITLLKLARFMGIHIEDFFKAPYKNYPYPTSILKGGELDNEK